MESTQAITKVLLQEAKDTAKHIIQEAKQAVEDIVEKQKQRGASRASEATRIILRKAENDVELIKLSMTADAKMKANWAVLSKKEQWITAVINETKKKLETFAQSKEYIPVLEKLIKDASIVLGQKELEVSLNERDSNLPLKLDKLSHEVSEKTKLKTKLSLSRKNIKAIGGVMVKTKNGKVIMDSTFDDIIRRREKDIRSKTAEILFK